MDKRLADRDFVAEEYSIADMAIYPWIKTLEGGQPRFDRFPNVKRWFDTIGARPATQRAYDAGPAVNTKPTFDEESKKILLGQGAEAVAA